MHGSILAIYLIATMVFAWVPSTWLKDALIAPVFIIFPLGFGLALLSFYGLREKLQSLIGKRELVLSALVLGWVLVTLIFLKGEYVKKVSTFARFGFPIMYVVAIYGLRSSSRLLADFWQSEFVANGRWYVAIFLAAGAIYYYQYLHFANFPERDIFQDIHFMKGALEFSRFGILNLFTADSYIPLLQVHWGLMNQFFGYDLLRSQWLLPPVILIFHFLCVRCFFVSLSFLPEVVNICSIIMIILNRSMFSKTNGDLLAATSLVLFASFRNVIKKPNNDVPNQSVLLAACMLLTLLLFKTQQVPNHWIVVAFLVLTYRWMNTSYLAFFWLALMTFLSLKLHRSVVMFLPAALIWHFVYDFFIRRSQVWSEAKTAARMFAVTFGFYIILGMMLLGWFALRDQFNVVLRFMSEFTHGLFSLMTGKILDFTRSNEAGDASFANTMIEWVRSSVPMLNFVVLILACAVMGQFVRKREYANGDKEKLQALFACSCVAAAATLLNFSNIPYIYRGLFFPTLFQIAIVGLCLQYANLFSYSRTLRFALIALVVWFSRFTALKVYNFSWDPEQIGNAYIRGLYPVNQSLFLLLMFLGLVCLAVRSASFKSWFATFVVVALLLDTIGIVTKFYEYSFGSYFPSPHIISHYDHRDIEGSKLLLEQPAGTLLFSDPYTLSISKATTGLNGLYSYENVADMSAAKKDLGRQIVASVAGNCRRLDNLLKSAVDQQYAFGPEATYGYERVFGRDTYNYQNARSSIRFVFTHRTFNWLLDRAHYFPEREELKPLETAMIERCFDIEARLGNYMMIAKLR